MQPTVRLATKAYQKIMHWVHKSRFEVSGLGLVKYDKASHTYTVTEVYLLDQKNTAGDTEIDDTAYAALELETVGVQNDENGWLNFWWHSHVDMGVFWSGTDMACIRKFSQNGYWLATVFNKKAEMRSAIAIGEPVGAFQDNLPTHVDLGMSAEEIAELDAEYKDKVRNPTTTTYTGYQGNNNYKGSSSTPTGGSSSSQTTKSESSHRGSRSDDADDEISLFEFMKRNQWISDSESADPDIQQIMARHEANQMDVTQQIEKDIRAAKPTNTDPVPVKRPDGTYVVGEAGTNARRELLESRGSGPGAPNIVRRIAGLPNE